MHGSISYPLWVASLGERSPVFADGRLRIKGERSQESHCPRFPHQPFPTTIKDKRGVTSHLQAPPQGKGLNLRGPASSRLSQKSATGRAPHPLGLHHHTLMGGGGVRRTVQHHQASLSSPLQPPQLSQWRQVKQSGQLGEPEWEGEATGYKNVTSS